MSQPQAATALHSTRNELPMSIDCDCLDHIARVFLVRLASVHAAGISPPSSESSRLYGQPHGEYEANWRNSGKGSPWPVTRPKSFSAGLQHKGAAVTLVGCDSRIVGDGPITPPRPKARPYIQYSSSMRQRARRRIRENVVSPRRWVKIVPEEISVRIHQEISLRRICHVD